MSKKKTNIVMEIFGMALNRYNVEKYKWQSYKKMSNLTYNLENASYSF